MRTELKNMRINFYKDEKLLFRESTISTYLFVTFIYLGLLRLTGGNKVSPLDLLYIAMMSRALIYLDKGYLREILMLKVSFAGKEDFLGSIILTYLVLEWFYIGLDYVFFQNGMSLALKITLLFYTLVKVKETYTTTIDK